MSYRTKSAFGLLIERAGLTQADLASHAAISRFFLNHLIGNRRNASGAVASRVADVYATTVSISQGEALEQLFVAVFIKRGGEDRQRDQSGRFVKSTSERTNEVVSVL